ncbi:MAG: hypothetical protein AB8F95_01700 [Bacteroidia bacterium]
MNSYKKTLLGSIAAFFIGTSCCWLSSLAIWLGGAAFIGTIASLVEDFQSILIGLGAALLIMSIVLYVKKKR